MSPTLEMTSLISTSNYVNRLEQDLCIPGNILFSDGFVLKTTDGISTTTVAGSSQGHTVALGQQAKFTWISGFRQISRTQVIVVDTNSNCLRLVDRVTLHTPVYAGLCGSAGYSHGTASARFNSPWGMILDEKTAGMLLVADRNNDAIRHVQGTEDSGRCV